MSNWKSLVVTVCVGATLLWASASRAAELKVFSDGPLRAALIKIVTDFRAETGHGAEVIYGTAPALKAKLSAGEKADVLISLAEEIEELDNKKSFAATQVSIASIKLALAVRTGIAVPNIKTLDQFKQTLLRADAIIHNNLASGRAFARQLERIGIAEHVRSKVVVIKGNTQLQELVKRTDDAVAAGQLTQIIADKSIQLVGALPPEAQEETIYSAGAFADTKSLDAARAFVRFLASPKAAATFAATGAK